MKPTLTQLDHLVLTVADIETSLRFYCDILGMTHTPFIVADGTTRSALAFGAQKINLHPKGGEFQPHAATPTAGSADLCFLSQTPLTDWITHLETSAVPLVQGPIQRTGATGPILSLYVRDPDGNLIEISNPL